MSKRLVRGVLGFYRLILSPALHLLGGAGSGCRYEPSCSRYAEEALALHGLRKGGWLALLRVLRCNPLWKSGYDPVPRDIRSPSLRRL